MKIVPLLIFIALAGSSYARTTVNFPKTSVSLSSSAEITVEASAVINEANVEEIEGTIEITDSSLTVGASLSTDDVITGILGYSNELTVGTTSVDYDLNAEINSESSLGSIALSSSSLYGEPSISAQAEVNAQGEVTSYEVDLSVGSSTDEVEMTVELSGAASETMAVEGSFEIGPVSATVTRSTDGLWDDTVEVNVQILDSPQVNLTGSVHRDTNDTWSYVLGFASAFAWGGLNFTSGNDLKYYIGGNATGTLLSFS